MTRNHAVFVAVLLSLSGLSSLSQAQTCDDDFDCASGKRCEFEGSSDGGDVAVGAPEVSDAAPPCDAPDCPTTEPDPQPEPITGTCQPLPKGLCVEQADCTTGLTCTIPMLGGTTCTEPAPAPGTNTDPVKDDCTSEPARPAPYGYCTLPETKCTNDSQCLLGLQCEESQSTGGIARPACDPAAPDCVNDDPAPEPAPVEESTCQVAFDDCTDTTQCSAGYECVERATGCSSSGSSGTGGGTVDPVPADGLAIDKQNDPACESESKCYPKYVACENDAQCQANWTCYAFEVGSGVGSELWEKETAGKGCLPKGLALAAEAGAAAGADGGKGVATGAPESAADSDGTAKSGSGNSSCALASGQSSSGAAWLLALALGLVSRRRRRALVV